MLMQAGPVVRACRDVEARIGKKPRVIYMTPQGRPFTQKIAEELATEEDLVFLCGHYEGIDERALELCVTDFLSAGDFVLTGGEIPAMAVTDAVCRMVPGVLAEEVCFTDESHWNGLLEYPQYTKPAVWHDREVPEVLLSGHHANIDRWRRKQSLTHTRKQRPDLFEQFEPQGKQDQKILDEIYLEDGIVRF